VDLATDDNDCERQKDKLAASKSQQTLKIASGDEAASLEMNIMVDNLKCAKVFCVLPAVDDVNYHHEESEVILSEDDTRVFLERMSLYPNMRYDYLEVNGLTKCDASRRWGRGENSKIEKIWKEIDDVTKNGHR